MKHPVRKFIIRIIFPVCFVLLFDYIFSMQPWVTVIVGAVFAALMIQLDEWNAPKELDTKVTQVFIFKIRTYSVFPVLHSNLIFMN